MGLGSQAEDGLLELQRDLCLGAASSVVWAASEFELLAGAAWAQRATLSNSCDMAKDREREREGASLIAMASNLLAMANLGRGREKQSHYLF